MAIHSFSALFGETLPPHFSVRNWQAMVLISGIGIVRYGRDELLWLLLLNAVSACTMGMITVSGIVLTITF